MAFFVVTAVKKTQILQIKFWFGIVGVYALWEAPTV
jgi:hypothetical protein